MKLILDVESCLDCPMRNRHGGQGESWWYCSHPQAPTGYDSILFGWGSKEDETPDWCPLKES